MAHASAHCWANPLLLFRASGLLPMSSPMIASPGLGLSQTTCSAFYGSSDVDDCSLVLRPSAAPAESGMRAENVLVVAAPLKIEFMESS